MAQNAPNRINENGLTIANVIRENPIPTAMLGVSLGWLFWSARQQRTRGASSRYADQLERERNEATAGEYAGEPEFRETFAETGADFETAESFSARTGQAVDTVKAAGSKLGARAKNAAGKVAEKTRNGSRRVQEQFFESPLAIGTATLAAGLAAGLVVPATRRESELVGDARDRLVDRVRNVTA